MNSARIGAVLALSIGLIAAGCGKEKPPARNQIPIIKESIYKLQQAVKERNQPALDSLLSSKIIDNGQSGDSLMNFCFGPERDFAFDRFGDCEIVYTSKHALARCYVMDTTSSHERPIRFTFVHEEVGRKKGRKSLWLLSQFDQKDLTTGSEDTTATPDTVPQ